VTPAQLRDLIGGGERLDVEFKGEARQPLSDSDLVEAVVCLANRPGDRPGWLLVGVEDDGHITGARHRHAGRTDPLRLQALLSNRTRPSLSARVEVVRLDGKDVVVVEAPAARSPVGTTDGKYLRRALGGDGKPACVPLHFHEMQSLQSSRGLLDYSAAVVPGATWVDLDSLELERFRRRIRESQGRGDASLVDLPDLELAKAVGAVDANRDVKSVRVAGLLLFGREGAIARHLPTHEVAFQVLSGTDVKVNDFFRWPLLRVVEEIEARFRSRHQETELMVGMVRVGVPDYPERALREALANAVIHRDYTRLGAVHVQWHEDRLEISNPGGFPDGVRLDNLLVTSPHPRNPLLADAFKRAGVVERTARGIDTIFYDFLRSGLPAPHYGRSRESDVVVVLRGGRPDLDWVRLVVEEGRAGRDLHLDDLLVLRAAAKEPVLDVPAACSFTQMDAEGAQDLLARLADWGLLQRQGRTALFGLSDAARRRLHVQQPDHRRARGTPLEVERAVMRHVAAHGQITRGQVSAEHGLGADQAKRLLAGMVARGLLRRRGEGRGAYYEVAQKKRATAHSFGRPPDSTEEPPDSVPGKAGAGGRKKAGKERKGR